MQRTQHSQISLNFKLFFVPVTTSYSEFYGYVYVGVEIPIQHCISLWLNISVKTIEQISSVIARIIENEFDESHNLAGNVENQPDFLCYTSSRS